MIAALILGRKGSVGFPEKNLKPVCGHPLAWYPMTAAKLSQSVDHVYLSTDDERLITLAKGNDVKVIERPDYLCTREALGEDAYAHGYHEIIRREGERPELVVTLFCNAATLLPRTIDEGVAVMREHPEFDSAVTVSRFNMYAPTRARHIDDDGSLQPFLAFDEVKEYEVSCDRDCQGDVWFADCSCCVARPENLENMDDGLPPQKWMGKRIYPLKQEAGCDVDFQWQMPMVEWWLQHNNFPYGVD
jgi:CMP-N-acetylneuraminic acid synthetase